MVSAEPAVGRGQCVRRLTPGTVCVDILSRLCISTSAHNGSQALMNQHIPGFVRLPLGAAHEEAPKTRESDWLVVRTDWMPACR